ncbi:MAG: ADP-ribosylglycohydrolase family protein, partial [Candidatus Hydrogenedentota bacterium]
VAQRTATISEAELLDKIKGAWAGQMIGVTVGGPTEFVALGEMYTKPVEWDPKRISDTLQQDDLYVEMTFCKVLDDEGIGAPMASFGKAFGASKYQLWHANFKARQNLLVGIAPPLSGHPDYNIHADDIDFQIESDFIGLMCPGMPNTAVEFADRVGRVMNYGDGVYGGMFMAAMYSAAFFETDVRRVLEAGISVVPKQSEFRQAVMFTIDAIRRHPDDLAVAWNEFQERWANTDACSAGALHPFDIDAKSNAAYVVFGLLYGEGDFKKTVESSVLCGQDSDCNPASAAGIIGAMKGYAGLDAEWRRELEAIGDQKFSYTEYSFNTISQSSMRHAKTVIKQNGGKIDGDSFIVALQTATPAPLEQWKQDKPIKRVGHDDPGFSFTGAWKDAGPERQSSTSGDTATYAFEGTGAIVMGRYDADCCIASVALDGKHVRDVNLFYDWRAYGMEGFREESLYHVFGLERGKHVISVTVTGKKHALATGAIIGIEGAILYDGPETAR